MLAYAAAGYRTSITIKPAAPISTNLPVNRNAKYDP